MPLGSEGWSVVLHEPECCDVTEDGVGQGACFADRVHFVAFPHHSDDLNLAIRRMSVLIGSLAGLAEDNPGPELPDTHLDSFLWVAAASTVVREDDEPGDVFGRASDLVIDSVAALRTATGWGIADPTIERMYPLYMTGYEDVEGKFEATGIVTVEHVWPGPPPPASPEQLDRAAHLVVAGLQRNPIETYRNFAMQARNAISHDGDYTKAVLLAAVASEVIIKHTAWMLTFESRHMGVDPGPTLNPEGLRDLKPSQLIGQVLQPRLRGNWESSRPVHPVGSWRQHIARKRAGVLHRGERVAALEADEAVIALKALEAHIVDRLAAAAATYPRTAFVQVGSEGLERRGKLNDVLELLERLSWSPDLWLDGYLFYVDGILDAADT